MISGAPKVVITEKNESYTTGLPTGSYASIVLAANKGEVGKAHLMVSEANLLNTYTANKTVDPGMDLGFYSALAFLQTGPIWVVRAAKNMLYGGVTIPCRGSAKLTDAFDTGEADMTLYEWPDGITDVDTLLAIYGVNQGDWNNNVAILLYPFHADDDIDAADFNYTNNTITTHIDISTSAGILNDGPTWTKGEAVKLVLKKDADDVLPTPLVANTTYYVIEGASANLIKLATTLANALNGVPIDISQGSEYLASGSSFTLSSSTKKCKTPGCFTLEVYNRQSVNSNTVLVESWTLSTMKIRDGYGNNVFIEDVLLGSNFVGALLNTGIAQDTTQEVYPKAVTGVISGSTVIPLFLEEGDDGSDLTDDTYSDFLSALENPDEVQLKFVLDGGHASPTYQGEIITLCEGRQDCFGVLSVPYTKESASDYLNAIVNYRKIDANYDTSFAAMYTPHLYVYDKFNDRPLYVSPDGYAAAIINLSGWLPPFGLNRGKIVVNAMKRMFKDAEMDYIFDNGINCLRFIPGKGTYVWGDKTMVAVPSALDGINVRMVLIDVEPTVKTAMESFIGEFVNDDATRALIRTKLNNYFVQVKSLQGVSDWYIICDQSNNTSQDQMNHTLNVPIYIKPMLSIRYISVPIIITAQGITFGQANVG